MKLHSTLLYMYYVLYCLSVSVLYLCMWPCCAFCEKKFQKTKAWNADIWGYALYIPYTGKHEAIDNIIYDEAVLGKSS